MDLPVPDGPDFRPGEVGRQKRGHFRRLEPLLPRFDDFLLDLLSNKIISPSFVWPFQG